jgi:ribA/ribD-fused uncharacterized protein
MLRDHLAPLKQEIHALKESIALKTVTQLSKRLADVEKENADLKRQVLLLDEQSRRNNLRFFAIPEIKNEKCEEVILSLLKEKCKISTFTDRTFERVHRQGHIKEGLIRPIVCKFHHLKDKLLVLQHRQTLSRFSIKISDDHSQQVDMARKQLLPFFHAALQHNMQPKLIGDKLILKEGQYGVNDINKLPKDILPENVYTITKYGMTGFFTKHSPLSNHHPSKFSVNDISYNCMEQYIMMNKAKLFKDMEKYTQLVQENDPKIQKQLGRKIENFQIKEWLKEVDNIVYNGLMAKFSQNANLKAFLMQTGDSHIFEASTDKIWGVGLNLWDKNLFDISKHAGKNKLGNLLMKVRDNLK